MIFSSSNTRHTFFNEFWACPCRVGLSAAMKPSPLRSLTQMHLARGPLFCRLRPSRPSPLTQLNSDGFAAEELFFKALPLGAKSGNPLDTVFLISSVLSFGG